MRVLLDQGTPKPLGAYLTGHTVDTAHQLGWSRLSNGELLDVAEDSGYDLLITTDQQIQYQQDLRGRKLAILVLLSTAWPEIRLRVEDILAAVNEIGPGALREIPI